MEMSRDNVQKWKEPLHKEISADHDQRKNRHVTMTRKEAI